MLSQAQLGDAAMTQKKQAMPEQGKFDGPAGIDTPGGENNYAANSTKPLPKPGFSS